MPLSLPQRSSLIIWLSVLVLCAVVLLVLIKIKGHLMQEKEARTRYLVETAHSLIAAAHADGIKRRLTMDVAKKNALASLKNLRYGENYYFWVNDNQPEMLMHPVKPELVGQDLSYVRDTDGKLLFMEMQQLANTYGEGFIQYYWPKPGESEPVSKISFVKLFEPWDWIVGSGVYIEDVNRGFYKYVVVFAIFLVFLILPIAFALDRNMRRH